MNGMKINLKEVIENYVEDYLTSRDVAAMMPDVEKQCEICRGAFPVDFYSTARICPECLRRLERMLYPERED